MNRSVPFWGAEMVNFPDTLVDAVPPESAPTTRTDTPVRGVPAGFTTVPVTRMRWASALPAVATINIGTSDQQVAIVRRSWG